MKRTREGTNLRTARDGWPFLDHRSKQPALSVFHQTGDKDQNQVMKEEVDYVVGLEGIDFKLD